MRIKIKEKVKNMKSKKEKVLFIYRIIVAPVWMPIVFLAMIFYSIGLILVIIAYRVALKKNDIRDARNELFNTWKL